MVAQSGTMPLMMPATGLLESVLLDLDIRIAAPAGDARRTNCVAESFELWQLDLAAEVLACAVHLSDVLYQLPVVAVLREIAGL